MKPSGVNKAVSAVKQFNDNSFAISDRFIIDSTQGSPSGLQFKTLQILADVEGFSCTDNLLLPGSASYPTVLSYGDKLYGSYQDITVTTGSILAII